MARKRKADADAPKRQHCDQITKERRIDEVVKLRIQACRLWNLRDYVRQNEENPESPWFLPDGEAPLSDGMLSRYIKDADEVILASVDRDRPRRIKTHLARREELYARAIVAGEVRVAHQVLAETAQLEGLYPDRGRSPDDVPPIYKPAPDHAHDADDTILEPGGKADHD